MSPLPTDLMGSFDGLTTEKVVLRRTARYYKGATHQHFATTGNIQDSIHMSTNRADAGTGLLDAASRSLLSLRREFYFGSSQAVAATAKHCTLKTFKSLLLAGVGIIKMNVSRANQFSLESLGLLNVRE